MKLMSPAALYESARQTSDRPNEFKVSEFLFLLWTIGACVSAAIAVVGAIGWFLLNMPLIFLGGSAIIFVPILIGYVIGMILEG